MIQDEQQLLVALHLPVGFVISPHDFIRDRAVGPCWTKASGQNDSPVNGLFWPDGGQITRRGAVAAQPKTDRY